MLLTCGFVNRTIKFELRTVLMLFFPFTSVGIQLINSLIKASLVFSIKYCELNTVLEFVKPNMKSYYG